MRRQNGAFSERPTALHFQTSLPSFSLPTDRCCLLMCRVVGAPSADAQGRPKRPTWLRPREPRTSAPSRSPPRPAWLHRPSLPSAKLPRRVRGECPACTASLSRPKPEAATAAATMSAAAATTAPNNKNFTAAIWTCSYTFIAPTRSWTVSCWTSTRDKRPSGEGRHPAGGRPGRKEVLGAAHRSGQRHLPEGVTVSWARMGRSAAPRALGSAAYDRANGVTPRAPYSAGDRVPAGKTGSPTGSWASTLSK